MSTFEIAMDLISNICKILLAIIVVVLTLHIHNLKKTYRGLQLERAQDVRQP